MTLRGLEKDSNPVGQTDLVKKLHSDPLNWGFLIEDEQFILDYPARFNDMYGNMPYEPTTRDLERLNRQPYDDEKVKVYTKNKRIDVPQQEFRDGVLVDVPTQAGGWIEAPTPRTQHFQFMRKLSQRMTGGFDANGAKLALRHLTAPVRDNRFGGWRPYSDIKVEITNPYTYTPYLLRKHKTRKKQKNQ